MKILRKNQKNTRNKNSCNENKECFQQAHEYCVWISQQKRPKLKKRENIEGKKIIQELWDNYKQCNICIIETLKEKEEQNHYLRK